MRILAFDTATRATAVALSLGDDRILEARDDPPPGQRPGHATHLLVLIAELLTQAGIGWAQVQRIAVGVGPGTFTGLRIGIATARALAQARSIPLVGVSTLQSLALGARRAPLEAGEPVLAVLDARRGEVFASAWRAQDLELGEPTLLAQRALTPEALAACVLKLGRGALAIGDGAVEFRHVLERSGAHVPPDDSELHRVSAANHCRLARGQPGGVPEAVGPAYLRLPDAEIARRS